MQTNQKQTWLSLALAICIGVIAVLGYYTWSLHQKIEDLQNRPYSGLPYPSFNNPHTWPGDWDPWSDNWDPTGKFSELQNYMDNLMNNMMPGNSIFSQQGFGLSPSSPKIDMENLSDKYVVTVTVPDSQDMELNTELADKVLTVSGKIKSSEEDSSDSLRKKSISTSRFSQSIKLTDPIDESRMEISHQGKDILITIPKKTG
ncbi:Hsp20/alpha crystallin family protein [Hahella ganghwensis]|uniref:Hsp20/alpha crystallin family protein n=1 Tax=Hahella ganghwensis TaxID=286420 RepID=UPI000360146A|nr:Hsp20/alpha crystallin family protein [Hahella ganghwensis]